MGRRLRSGTQLTVYRGLAVLGLGLFASALQGRAPDRVDGPSPTPTPRAEAESPHALKVLHEHLRESEWFRTRVDGVRLSRTPHRVVISIESDELYEGQSASVSEAWLPLIDGLARTLLPELGPALQVRVEGFKEDRDETQGVSVFTQLGDYRLATDRASWLVDHLERNFPGFRRLKVRLGAGVASSAERVEIHIEMR